MSRIRRRGAGWRAASVVVAVALAACGGNRSGTSGAVAVAFPLKVSASGRTLVDQSNRPFRLNIDAAWFMSVNATATDVDTYLADRRAKGFTGFILMAMVHPGGYPTVLAADAPKNRMGQAPFTTAGDFSTPNDAYWTFIDSIIDKAAAQGLVVVLAYAYLGFEGGDQGWWADINSAPNTQAVMFNYGVWLGNRYRNRTNILWHACGDYAPPTGSEGSMRVHKAVEGIKSVIPGALFSAEMSSPDQIPTEVPDFAAVMDTNSFYGYGPGRNGETFVTADRAWQVSPPRPAWMAEPSYEGETVGGTGDRADVRRSHYWAVMGGSTAGQNFGTVDLWSFQPGWAARMGSQGSQDMQRLFALFGSLPWHELSPSGTGAGYVGKNLVASGQASGAGHIGALANSSGTWLVAYAPATGAGPTTFGIDMSALSGPARARWYNPTSGAYTMVGTGLANTGTRSFTTPGDNGSGANDWVLVIDFGS